MLSDDLRDELATIAPEAECDRLAELSGLFHVAGSAHLRGRGAVDVHLDLASSAVARRAFALLRSFQVDSEIRTYQRAAFDKATRYQLHVEGSPTAYETLHHAGVLDASHRPVDHPPRRVLSRHCCRRSYLRGALLGAGSLSGPRDPHLEIRTAEIEGARFLADVAEREGARAARPRPRPPCGRLCQGNGDDRRRARRRRCGRRRPRPRGAFRRRRDARRRKPARQCRSREPRPHEPRRACPARSGAPAPGGRRARRALTGASGGGVAPAPVPDALDRRARPTLQAAGDESLRVPAASPPPGARGAVKPAIRLAKRLAHFVTTESYSPRRVRARPAADSDPVRRHGLGCGCTGGEGRPRSFPSGPAFLRRNPCNVRPCADFAPGTPG